MTHLKSLWPVWDYEKWAHLCLETWVTDCGWSLHLEHSLESEGPPVYLKNKHVCVNQSCLSTQDYDYSRHDNIPDSTNTSRRRLFKVSI